MVRLLSRIYNHVVRVTLESESTGTCRIRGVKLRLPLASSSRVTQHRMVSIRVANTLGTEKTLSKHVVLNYVYFVIKQWCLKIISNFGLNTTVKQ